MTRSLLLPVLFLFPAFGLVPARSTNVVESRTVRAPASAAACSSAKPSAVVGQVACSSAEPSAADSELARSSAALRAQDDAGGARKDDPYPALKHATVVRFYSLEGDIKADVLRKAVAELSTKEIECRIAGEPSVSSTRPGKNFIAIEAPFSTTHQDVEKALRKSNARVQELEWSLFRGAKHGPTPILGYSGRDCVIGMSSEMRWFEFTGETSSFYFMPGKLRAAKLEDLYRKLYQPFGGGDLGKLARETIQWTLKAPIEDAAARRAEKTLAKIDGVREAKIDAASGGLRMIVELDGLKTSGPMPTGRTGAGAVGGADSATSVIPRFDTNPLFDALAKEQLTIAPRKD